MARDRQTLLNRMSHWTAQYLQGQRRLCQLGCVGCAAAAWPVFYLTFWVIYAVLWVGFQGLLTTHSARLVGSWCVVLLLIPAYVTANWNELRSLKFESSDRQLAARAIAHASGMPGLAFLAGPQTAHAFVKVLSSTLLLGPGLVHLAFRLGARSKLLSRLDADAVSQALAILIEQDQRVSLNELSQKTHAPEDRLLADLALIEGVVPLKSGELGYTLNEELRQELLRYRPRVAEQNSG
jgi:hypothetical protein